MNNRINVINYHLTKKCNYNCKACFASKQGEDLEYTKVCKVCDRIQEFFKDNKVDSGRVNFAGGEPMMCPFLIDVIKHCASIGLKTSIITNGYLLTPDKICELADVGVEMIGISVDSIKEEVNRNLGRCLRNNKTLSHERLQENCTAIKKHGLKLKINSCITKQNCNEDLYPLLDTIQYDRFKILRAFTVEGHNDHTIETASTEEFVTFCNRHARYNPVIEGDNDMENSYIILDQVGNLISNENNKNTIIGNCLDNPIQALFSKIAFNTTSYDKRYK